MNGANNMTITQEITDFLKQADILGATVDRFEMPREAVERFARENGLELEHDADKQFLRANMPNGEVRLYVIYCRHERSK
jgi:hypothetical protein